MYSFILIFSSVFSSPYGRSSPTYGCCRIYIVPPSSLEEGGICGFLSKKESHKVPPTSKEVGGTFGLALQKPSHNNRLSQAPVKGTLPFHCANIPFLFSSSPSSVFFYASLHAALRAFSFSLFSVPPPSFSPSLYASFLLFPPYPNIM